MDKRKRKAARAENGCPLRILIKLEYHFFIPGKENQIGLLHRIRILISTLGMVNLGSWAQGHGRKFLLFIHKH